MKELYKNPKKKALWLEFGGKILILQCPFQRPRKQRRDITVTP